MWIKAPFLICVLGLAIAPPALGQDACTQAWIQYKDCVAAIVNRGGADVSSCGPGPSCTPQQGGTVDNGNSQTAGGSLSPSYNPSLQHYIDRNNALDSLGNTLSNSINAIGQTILEQQQKREEQRKENERQQELQEQNNSPSAPESPPPEVSVPSTDDSAAQSSGDQAPTNDNGAAQVDEQQQENDRAAEREREFEAQKAQETSSQNDASPSASDNSGNDSSGDSSILTASAEDRQPEIFKEEYASVIQSAQADQPQPAEPSEPMDNVVQLASNSVSSDGSTVQQTPESPVWKETSSKVSADNGASAAGPVYESLQAFTKEAVVNVQEQMPEKILQYEAEGVLPDPVEITQTAFQEAIQSRAQESVRASLPNTKPDETEPVDDISTRIDSTFGKDLMVQLTKNGAGLSPLNNAKAVWGYLSNIVKIGIVKDGTAQVQAPLDGTTSDQ